MKMYAILDENLNVINLVRSDEDIESEFIKETDMRAYAGKSYDLETGEEISDLPGFRLNRARIGMDYNKDLDAFVEHKYYDSWILDTSTGLVNPPVPYPDDGGEYIWFEAISAWITPDQLDV